MNIDLLIFFGHVPVEHLRAGLDAAWSWPHVVGPYAKPEDQDFVATGSVNLDEAPWCFGVATLPNGKQSSISSYVVPDESGYWLYLGISIDCLSRSYQMKGYPFGGSATDEWAKEVYAFLFDLACWIYPRAKFDRGIIGFLTLTEVDELANGSLPDLRYHGYLREENGKLKYFAPNIDQPYSPEPVANQRTSFIDRIHQLIVNVSRWRWWRLRR